MPCPCSMSLRAGRLTHRRHALLHFFGGNVFDVSRDRPHVAEWIEQRSRAIAIKLVFYGMEKLGSVFNRFLNYGVHVLDIDEHAGGSPANRLGAHDARLRILVGQHHDRVAYFQLRVNDFAVGPRHAQDFRRSEDAHVEINREGRGSHEQIGSKGVVSLGDWFYGCHGSSSFGWSRIYGRSAIPGNSREW